MINKQCCKCKQFKLIKYFYKSKTSKDGLRSWCKDCCKMNNKNLYLKYQKNRILYQRLYNNKFPWNDVYRRIYTRCNIVNHKFYKYYGGRGIKCLITKEELKELWFRDKAYLLKRPSIDRIDNDGNYCFENCEFIELKENLSKNKTISVLQFALDGNFIKEWKSMVEIKNSLGFFQSSICKCCQNKLHHAYGFIWKYKNEK